MIQGSGVTTLRNSFMVIVIREILRWKHLFVLRVEMYESPDADEVML